MELKGLKINFLGDSITEGFGASDKKFFIPERIEAEYGAICRNYGIGGTKIAIQKVPSECPIVDRYFNSRVDEMDPDADLIIIFGGTNDFGHGDVSLGTMSDRTPETFYGALHELYQHVLKRYPDAVIAILTPLHRWNEDNPCGDVKPKPVAPLKTYVEIIKEVAAFYALPVCDLFTQSGIQPQVDFIRERLTIDGLHPNDVGYVRLTRQIARFIQNL